MGINILCHRSKEEGYEMQPLRNRNSRRCEVTDTLRPHEGNSQRYLRPTQGNYDSCLVDFIF